MKKPHRETEIDATKLMRLAYRLVGDGEGWQARLATYLGVDASTVWRWVKRDRVPPAVAKGLHCLARET